MKNFLFALILGLTWKNSLAQFVFTCDPFEDCAAIQTPGAVVPDPNNCENYYICISVNGEIVPSTSPIPCGDGKYFDIEKSACIPEDSPGTCGANVCSPRSCISTCPSPFANVVYIANKFDCSTYYICLTTGSVLATCPTNTPYFDGTTCVSDASKCCDFCTAFCTEAGTQIVDPCDCTSYYICVVPGPVQYRQTCRSGTYYDETTATCITGSCNSICSNCDTQNPTTSSSAGPTTTAAGPTTTTTTTTTTTNTTPGSGCQTVGTFTCPNDGNYPMCPYCYKDYFSCQGGVASVGSCNGNNVFNPVTEYPYCLDPSNCPYP